MVVDDEKLIVKGIKSFLEYEEMKVDTAYDGEEALRLASENKYSLIVLDVMLPKINGLDVCRAIREFSDIPIIMLTAKGDDMDKIMGLEYGADDYITKPFNILELKARIKAILRRSVKKSVESPKNENRLKIRGIEIEKDSRRVIIEGKDVNITAREFDLLALFMENQGKVYSREKLLELIWGKDCPGDLRSVDVHVRRLREKIEKNPSEPKYLHTKWGVGYYFQ